MGIRNLKLKKNSRHQETNDLAVLVGAQGGRSLRSSYPRWKKRRKNKARKTSAKQPKAKGRRKRDRETKWQLEAAFVYVCVYVREIRKLGVNPKGREIRITLLKERKGVYLG